MAEDKGKKEEEKAKAEAPAEGDADAAATPKKSKKKLIIIIAVLVIILGAVGGLFATGVIGGSGKADDKSAEKSKDAKDSKDADAADADKCKDPAPAGDKKEDKKEGDKKEGAVDPCKPVYVDVPDLIVNLASESRRQHFVNLKITLEVKNPAAATAVTDHMPRIVDSFNTYLREMTKEDLEGSEGLIRLEDEMMLRINKILKPGVVTAILYRSVIVQ